MEDIWKSLLDFFVKASADFALKIVVAALLFFVGSRLIRLLGRLFARSMAKSKLDDSVKGFLESLLSISLRVMLVISLLVFLGVPATSFIAILTSAGLAVGLALQGSLSNFAGGLMILFFRPFRMGDFIKTGSAEGTVQNISIMYTTLKTLDGKKVVIPNAMLSNSVITDFSWYETRRIDVSVTLGFSHPVEEVIALMEGAARAESRVLADPPPAASLDRIEDGAQVFTLRCWVKTGEWWATNLAVTRAVKEGLLSGGIRAAAPLREVRQQNF